MAGTFLGKWTIFMYVVLAPELDGYASYEDPEFGTQMGSFCLWYTSPPSPAKYQPHKNNGNIAFILRDDGQVYFLLNNGQYVQHFNRSFGWGDNQFSSLAGFTFPEQDPHNLPPSFSSWIKYNDQYVAPAFIPGNKIMTSDSISQVYSIYQLTQVTASPSSLKGGADGTGMDFAWVDLTGVDLSNCKLADTDFSNCNLTNVNFSGSDLSGATLTTCNLTGADFTGANLSGANLVGASFTNTKLSNATLARAILKGCDLSTVIADPLPKFYNAPLSPPSQANPLTNLSECRLNQNLLGSDWSMLDLSSATILNLPATLSSQAQPLHAYYSNFQGLNSLAGLSIKYAIFNYAVLDGLELSRADLTGASFQQSSLHGTNLTNATLESAKMTGAQLGAISRLFTLPLSSKSDLAPGNVDAALASQFAQNGKTLSSTATLSEVTPGVAWSLNDASHNLTYTIRLETNPSDNSQTLVVYGAAHGALLSHAYMPDAILTGANLFSVVADHIHFYGSDSTPMLDGSAILEDAQLNDSNLSRLNFTQAQLLGTNFSGSDLFGANFRKANLSPSASGAATNLNDCNLQGANFTDATLHGATLENAAVAINLAAQGAPARGGVYLFSLPLGEDANTLQQYFAELNSHFTLPYQDDHKRVDDYVADLRAGNITDFKVAFHKQEPPITLSNSAAIAAVGQETARWVITDGSTTYRLGTGVDMQGKMWLYVSLVIPKLEAAFQAAQHTLFDGAVIQTEVTASQWSIDASSDDAQNLSTGYSGFLLRLNTAGTGLEVYGTAFRMLRLGDNNQLEFDTETCGVTILTVDRMDAETVLPNGLKLRSNQAGGVQWDDRWMRSALKPPQPPTCVPTDYSWCPQTQTQGADNRPVAPYQRSVEDE